MSCTDGVSGKGRVQGELVRLGHPIATSTVWQILAEHPIRRKQVLGGLTHEYYIAALPPTASNAGHQPESYFRAPQDQRRPTPSSRP